MDEAALLGLHPEHFEALLRDGYAVVDGILGKERAAELRAEAVAFADAGKLVEHRFQFGHTQFKKPNIFEADMYSPTFREALPKIAALHDDDGLVATILDNAPSLRLGLGTSARSLKLQHNKGKGGCFPLHYDNAGPPSKRAITCIIYLNPDWKEGDGGEIELAPFLGPRVVVPPLMDRAVLFRSDLILHRVRPSFADRFCFTIWIDSDAINGPDECNLKAKHLVPSPETVQLLQNSPVQRALSRAVYAEAYEESLAECMGSAPGAAEMLAEHKAHVARNMAHPQLGPFVEYLRALRPDEAEN